MESIQVFCGKGPRSMHHQMTNSFPKKNETQKSRHIFPKVTKITKLAPSDVIWVPRYLRATKSIDYGPISDIIRLLEYC